MGEEIARRAKEKSLASDTSLRQLEDRLLRVKLGEEGFERASPGSLERLSIELQDVLLEHRRKVKERELEKAADGPVMYVNPEAKQCVVSSQDLNTSEKDVRPLQGTHEAADTSFVRDQGAVNKGDMLGGRWPCIPGLSISRLGSCR